MSFQLEDLCQSVGINNAQGFHVYRYSILTQMIYDFRVLDVTTSYHMSDRTVPDSFPSSPAFLRAANPICPLRIDVVIWEED